MGKFLRILTVFYLLLSIAVLTFGWFLHDRREILKGRTQQLGAVQTGRHPNVDLSAVDGHTVLGRLCDRVRFGMGRPDAVLVRAPALVIRRLDEVAYLVAVSHALGGTHIACYQHLLIPYDHTTGTAAVAGCTPGCSIGQVHKIFIP